jgi:hypothetical protein
MNEDILEQFGVDCEYHDLSTISNISFSNSLMHLNIRSISKKLGELEALINLTGSPKVLMLSETWLTNSAAPLILTIILLSHHLD